MPLDVEHGRDDHQGTQRMSSSPSITMARRLLACSGRVREQGVEQDRARRPCRAGGSGCRTSATARTTGSPRRSSQSVDGVAGGAQPVGRGVGSRARRSRRRRGGRRTRRRSAGPVSGCSAVETPPMSHRSQVATSGSSPIEQCSAAWAAPGTSAGGSPASSTTSSGTVHQTATVRSVRSGRSSGSSPITSPPGCRRLRYDTTCWVTSTSPSESRHAAPVGVLAAHRGPRSR